MPQFYPLHEMKNMVTHFHNLLFMGNQNDDTIPYIFFQRPNNPFTCFGIQSRGDFIQQ